MDEVVEVDAYDEMDHQQVNQQFVRDLLASGPVLGTVLDVGTGTARIPILLCQATTSLATCVACDASPYMIAVAQNNVQRYDLDDRIQLRLEDAKHLSFPDGGFDCVISNSLIHHLPAPGLALAEMIRVTRPGGRLFVRDLVRPDSLDEVDRLVQLHAAGEPPASQALLAQSLTAALTLNEVRSLVTEMGDAEQNVRLTSDRHWTWSSTR